MLDALGTWQKDVGSQIDALEDFDDEEKEDLKVQAEKIAKEAAKGEEANPKKMERWLNVMVTMTPDILEITVASLVNPLAGVGLAAKKINNKIKLEREG